MTLQANAFTVISCLLLVLLWNSQRSRFEAAFLGAVMIGFLIARVVSSHWGTPEGRERPRDGE